MVIRPRIPDHWPGFSLRYRYRNTIYEITVDNQAEVAQPVFFDDVPLEDGAIPLQDDGRHHSVVVYAKALGEQSAVLTQWSD